MAASPDELLADLDPSQRVAVTTEAAPLAILAGAGSGKTRVLTRRIAWQARTGSIDASRVLAVTFTRKAARELTARLAALGAAPRPVAGTIHAIALAQLRRRASEQGRSLPVVLERKARVLVPLVGGRGARARLAAAEVAGEIEWAKARLIGADGYVAAARDAGRAPSRPPAEIADLFARYEREKRSRGLLDFDDLLSSCAAELERDTGFAQAQRWRFRHLFVDEFQDVSPSQLRLVRAWLGDRPDLCVVGDPDQAIYSFAGADASFLTGFGRTFPGGQVVSLERNYRSTPAILASAEAVLADGGRARPVRVAVQADGPAPAVTSFESGEAEASGVAAQLRAASRTGVAWSDMAILYRTNAQSAAFEEALTRARIPFRVRGDGRFLDRAEVHASLDDLRARAAATPAASLASHLAAVETDPGPRSEQERDHVQELLRRGREYLAAEGGTATVDGFIAFLAGALGDDAPEEAADAVQLLTFHRAKGLEFERVYVTGLERGLVPISHATTTDDRAEERRLLYVALTRAKNGLHLSYARRRTLGLHTVHRAPSPWLGPIEASLSGAPAPPPGDGTPAQLASARDRLARADVPAHAARETAADTALFAALVEWRRNLARAASVPAYVIFPDATLRAVAARKPRSRVALLALPGIGPVKAERHGPAVLDLVRRHAS